MTTRYSIPPQNRSAARAGVCPTAPARRGKSAENRGGSVRVSGSLRRMIDVDRNSNTKRNCKLMQRPEHGLDVSGRVNLGDVDDSIRLQIF